MDITDLSDLEAIKRLKYRYLRCLDQKLWDELADCLTPGATASFGGGAYILDDRDSIIGFLVEHMGSERVLSSHRCHHPEIELDPPAGDGSRTAAGVWAMDDRVLLLELDVTVSGAAFYTDRYRRSACGGWRIASTGYKRTFEEVQLRSAQPGLAVTADWYATDGRSELPAG